MNKILYRQNLHKLEFLLRDCFIRLFDDKVIGLRTRLLHNQWTLLLNKKLKVRTEKNIRTKEP